MKTLLPYLAITILFLSLNINVSAQSQCPTSFIVNTTNETAYGACDGTLTFTLTGGAPDFIYTIIDTSNVFITFTDTSGLSTYTFTNLCPGTYECIVTDTSGVFCPASGSGSGATYATILPGAAALTLTCDVIGINCWNQVGDVQATATGDAPPFLYSLNGGLWTSSSYFSSAQWVVEWFL